MKIEEIGAELEVDPEKEKAFGRQVCQSLKGRVSMGLWNLAADAIKVSVIFLLVNWLLAGVPGWIKMLIYVPGMLAAVLYIWYQLSWELTFDGESGFFSYKTMFHEEIRFHVSEIKHFGVEKVPFWRARTSGTCDMLYIEVGEEIIDVRLKVYAAFGGENFMSSYVNADKLLEYLEMYRRYNAPHTRKLMGEGLSAGVAAAIAAKNAGEEEQAARERAMPGKVSLKKTGRVGVPLEKKADPGTPGGKVSLPKAEPEAVSAPEPFSLGETPPAQEASPAPKVTPEPETPDVDVNALFDSVVKQYAKNAEKARPERRRRRRW